MEHDGLLILSLQIYRKVLDHTNKYKKMFNIFIISNKIEKLTNLAILTNDYFNMKSQTRAVCIIRTISTRLVYTTPLTLGSGTIHSIR